MIVQAYSKGIAYGGGSVGRWVCVFSAAIARPAVWEMCRSSWRGQRAGRRVLTFGSTSPVNWVMGSAEVFFRWNFDELCSSITATIRSVSIIWIDGVSALNSSPVNYR
jgi:hypothetical protein